MILADSARCHCERSEAIPAERTYDHRFGIASLEMIFRAATIRKDHKTSGSVT